jgi:hypothetical protein
MATDAQGRPLSDDGNYYWDGSAWQSVQQDASQQSGGSSQGPALASYSGDGKDLTQEQLAYLNQHLVRTPNVGPQSVDSVGQGSLSDQSTEQEWA